MKLNILKLVLIGILSGDLFMPNEKVDSVLAKSLIPCQNPLTYQLGEIDSRFGITEEEVEKAMESAAAMWSSVLGRSLAVYDENGAVVINLVYDDRQELVDGEWRYREKVRTEQVLTNQLQQVYDYHRIQFEKRSEEYVELVYRTQLLMDIPHNRVDIEHRKSYVERLQKQVLSERKILDEEAEKVNKLLDRLNQRVADENKLIEQYNEDFSGESLFAKATYQQMGDGGVITVNQFKNKKELPLLMAHELGHAFGLNHVSNPRSVMHGRMGAQQIDPTVQLTQEDRQAIRNRCR